jgi:hypothetical protein
LPSKTRPKNDDAARDSWWGAARERALLGTGLVALFSVGYCSAELTNVAARAHVLTLSLDRSIPFVRASVWIYLWVFPAATLPLFVVRCPRLFRRASLAYAAAIIISSAVFVAFPVTSRPLRVETDSLDLSRASDWAVALVYHVDPPYNLFPSLHISIATLAALAVWRASPRRGAVALVAVAMLSASVCTVKQHFVLDAVGGVVLATALNALLLATYRPPEGASVAYSWRGLAAYVAMLAVVYSGYYAVFLVGSHAGWLPSRR